MERINVTKRVFRIGIFSNRGKSPRGQKKKKREKTSDIVGHPNRSRPVRSAIISSQVVTNSRLPIRPLSWRKISGGATEAKLGRNSRVVPTRVRELAGRGCRIKATRSHIED